MRVYTFFWLMLNRKKLIGIKTNSTDLYWEAPMPRSLRGETMIDTFMHGSCFRSQDLSTKLISHLISGQQEVVRLSFDRIVIGSKVIITTA